MLRDLVCTRLFCGAPYCPSSFLGTVVQSRELPLEGRVIVCAIVSNRVLPLSPAPRRSLTHCSGRSVGQMMALDELQNLVSGGSAREGDLPGNGDFKISQASYNLIDAVAVWVR